MNNNTQHTPGTLTIIVAGEIEGSLIASVDTHNDGAYFRADIHTQLCAEFILVDGVIYWLKDAATATEGRNS